MKTPAVLIATGLVLVGLGAAPAQADGQSAGRSADTQRSSTLPTAPSARAGTNQVGLTTTEWKGIQRWLRTNYGYTGAIDGQAGNGTWRAMQRYLQRFYGYAGAIDGVAGTNTIKALQRCLSEGTYAGPIDGIVGPATVAAMKVFARKFA